MTLRGMKLFRDVSIIVCIAGSLIVKAGDRPVDKATVVPNPDQPIAAELQPLQGTWEGSNDKAVEQITITITGSSLHFFRDTNFWFKTTIVVPAGKNPRQLHATIREGAPGQESSVGQVVIAIFKVEDGVLTLVTGGEEPPKTFEPGEDNSLSRYVLRKAQTKRKSAAPGSPD